MAAHPFPTLQAALAGRYALQRELGAGGMATVYLARDERHDRDVAIKVLHPDLGAALGAERFLAEIKTTARLQHPHILPLLDSGSAGGLLYYVMPYVAGESLRDRLARERQLPVDEAIGIAREVAGALSHAHGLGVVHRDIKPENILLQGGHALVADFGIALAVQQAGGARMTQTGLSLGTPSYMSPEQATGERAIDARSDIYALGAVTYEMLTGEPPFTGPSIQAIVARVMTEEPRGIVVQRKAVPPEVEDAVLRALEKLPADRFASAAEFAAALTSVGTTGTRGTAARAAARRPQRALPVAMGAAALLAAIAAWGWLRPVPAPPVVRYAVSLEPATDRRNWMGSIAISPDGATLVHTDGPDGVLLVRRRDELSFTPLAGTEGAMGPAFSPDGRQILFFADGKLLLADISGGRPVVVQDSVLGAESYHWGTDGYVYRHPLRGAHAAIVRMEPRPGSALEVVTEVDTAAGEWEHGKPELLPDGTGVLFSIEYRNGERAIGIADLATRRHTVLMPGVRVRRAGDRHLLYTTNDGKLWLVPFDFKARRLAGAAEFVAEGVPLTMAGPVDFAVSASGTLAYRVEDASALRELAWVARDGSRQPVDSGWRAEFSSPALSPDGSRIAVTVRTGGVTHVWIKPVTAGSAAQLTVGTRSNTEPAWTPDGRALTFVRNVSGTSSLSGEVWIQPVDGSAAARQLLTVGRLISEQAWSPAGEWLLVRTTTPSEGAGDILAARPLSDTAVTPVVATARSEYTPSFSPDGRWVAYTSAESGRLEIFVAPFPNAGADARQVSTNGGMAPRWSPRGDEIFYLDRQMRMVAAQVATSPTFALRGSTVLFPTADAVQRSVSRRNYDVSRDGQRFLMVLPAPGGPSMRLVVVENWLDEVRRKAAAK